MAQHFLVPSLPEIDRREVERGLCPWCLERLADGAIIVAGGQFDECHDCGDRFYASAEAFRITQSQEGGQ